MSPAAAPRAALLVSAALLLPGALPSAPAPRSCEDPGELAARDGRTLLVSCRADAAQPPLRGPARRLFGLPIDPNRADRLTLETFPGIGPARAGAIEAERCRRAFAAPRDLARVHGIGPGILARLAPELAVLPGSEPSCRVD